MKKVFIILLVVVFFQSCVSNKKYMNMVDMQKTCSDNVDSLKNLISKKDSQIKKLKLEISYLTEEKLDKDKIINSLKNKIIEIKKSPEYLYNEGIKLFNSKAYYKAEKKFKYILKNYSNNSYAELSRQKLIALVNISKNNLKKISSSIKGKKNNEKYNILTESFKGNYLSNEDSLYLSKIYNKIKANYETEKYINVSEDKMQSCYFYETTRNTVQLYGEKEFDFYVYIGQKYSGYKWLRLKTSYSGEDWIFYEEVIIKGDNGYQISIKTDYPSKESDSYSYGVKEWSDNSLNSIETKKLIKISESNEIDVRYRGKYSFDITLNENQLKAFKEIINKYKKL